MNMRADGPSTCGDMSVSSIMVTDARNCVQAIRLLQVQMPHGLGTFATYIATHVQRVAQRPDTVRCDIFRVSS